MNKIEEILKEYGISDIPFDENITMYYPTLLNAVKEFGEICFEAGRETKRISKYTSGYNPKGTSDDTWVDKYDEFEDFLKEIEDGTGN